MKVLFVGVGSIGTRHIKDFYNICYKNNIIPEIYVLRRKVTELDLIISDMVTMQLVEIPENVIYDAVFITNPTNLHFDMLKKLCNRGKYYFVEKPIFDHLNYDFESLGLSSSNTYVAAPMRHSKTFNRLKEIVKSERVFSARIICSSYLPEWRPNIDYRNNYSAIKEMGGGVALDLVHEIDYMIGLFGIPNKSHCFHGKYSNLEITSDDLSVYIVEYSDLICEIHLDYFGREYRRECELFTENGTYIANFYDEIIKKPDGSLVNCKDEINTDFINEMNYFYEFIMGSGVIVNDPEKALETLRIALGEG